MAVALGLPAAAQRRDAERLAFAQLLRRRELDAAAAPAPTAPSRSAPARCVERLALALRANAASAAASGSDPRVARPIAPHADPPRRAAGRRRTAAAAPVGQRLRGPARLPLSLLRPARARRCALPTSSTPRSRSATTARGCMRCCTRSISNARPARRAEPTWRDCMRIGRGQPAKRTGSTPLRSCRSAPASRCFVPRYVAWLHRARSAAARLVARRGRPAREARRRWAASSCTAASTAIDVVARWPPARADRLQDRQRQPAQEDAARPARGHPARLLRRARGRRERPAAARRLPGAGRRRKASRRSSTPTSPRAPRRWSTASADDLRRLRDGAALPRARRGTGLRVLRRTRPVPPRPLVAARR